MINTAPQLVLHGASYRVSGSRVDGGHSLQGQCVLPLAPAPGAHVPLQRDNISGQQRVSDHPVCWRERTRTCDHSPLLPGSVFQKMSAHYHHHLWTGTWGLTLGKAGTEFAPVLLEFAKLAAGFIPKGAAQSWDYLGTKPHQGDVSLGLPCSQGFCTPVWISTQCSKKYAQGTPNSAGTMLC